MQLLRKAGWFQARGEIRRSVIGPHFFQSFLSLLLFLALVVWLIPSSALAAQKHPLLQGQPELAQPQPPQAATAAYGQEPGAGSPGSGAAGPGGGASSATPAQPIPGQEAGSKGALPSAPALGQPGEKHETLPAGKGEAHAPGAEAGAHGEHGVKLPELSPIPGVTFVETMIQLLDHELHGRTLGWRPNDLVFGRFTDNMNNFQLGVLETLRFTMMRLKDSLTRMGDADAYDRDLEQALNLLMNRATLFMFPSAETSYQEALGHLQAFLQKLKSGQRNFYYRVDNLHSLIVVYKDLLGNVNRSLIMANHVDGTPVSWFEVDDYFYYAKGVAHVLFEIFKVVRVGFKAPLDTLRSNEIMDEMIHELHRTEQMEPWIILDSNLGGIFANHRANLNAPLSEVLHLLTVMSQF
jgi:hypothetical protein